MGKVDTTLFVKNEDQDILVYKFMLMILCSTNESLCKGFSSYISKGFSLDSKLMKTIKKYPSIKQNMLKIYLKGFGLTTQKPKIL